MSTQVTPPGYVSGKWAIDPARSDVSFQAKLLGFVKVRGTFTDVEGTVVLAEDPLDSSVNAVIKVASVSTKNPKRDEHLLQDDFLLAEEFPTMTFNSTGVRPDGDNFLVEGDLTIRAVTKRVTLNLEPKGFEAGADGEQLARFSASTEIVCTDYGVTRGKSSAVVSAKNAITLEITAKQQG